MDTKEFNETLLKVERAEMFDDALQLSAKLLGYNEDQICDGEFQNTFIVLQNTKYIRSLLIETEIDTKSNFWICGKWIIVFHPEYYEFVDELESKGLYPISANGLTYRWLVEHEKEQYNEQEED